MCHDSMEQKKVKEALRTQPRIEKGQVRYPGVKDWPRHSNDDLNLNAETVFVERLDTN